MVPSRAFLAMLLVGACGEVKLANDAAPGASADASEGADAMAPDGSAVDAAGADAAPSDRRVFVTSRTFPGDLGGLAGADAQCQGAAVSAGLRGTYLAWLSDSTGSPSTRMTQDVGPYRLVDGTEIAADWADLTDGSIAAPIDLDELGDPSKGTFVCQGGEVWTSTTASGTPRGDIACADWISTEETSSAGNVGFTDVNWTESACSVITCESSLPLYCVEQ